MDMISRRVFFINDTCRDLFFSKLKTVFNTWTNLGKQTNIYKSRLELFRNGEFSIPEPTFLELLHYLSKEDYYYFMNKIYYKEAKWRCSKGGIINYKKNPHIYVMARKKALVSPNRNPSIYKFSFEMPLTYELCEVIGAFIGDGHTSATHSCVVGFTGSASLDYDYLSKKLPYLLSTFSENVNPRLYKYDNILRLNINSKQFHNLLTKRFGFPAGKKTYIVKIPNEILNSDNPIMMNYCVRGIFDTDGCVAFDKRKTYTKPYLRICLNMMSKELINQIHNFLIERGIRSTKTKESKIIQINGIEECKKFVRIVGFSNMRHLKKINNIFDW